MTLNQHSKSETLWAPTTLLDGDPRLTLPMWRSDPPHVERIRTDMMVGDEQAILADEAAGTAGVEAHARPLQPLQKAIGDVKVVPLAQQFARGWLKSHMPWWRTSTARSRGATETLAST